MASPRQVRKAYPPGTVPRATLNLSPDYLRVLEQQAYSGQALLSPEQLRNVTGGGVVEDQLQGKPAVSTPSVAARFKTNVPLNAVIGSEFGEVDRPSRGGYTEPNWNRGFEGADLSGSSNEGVALPPKVLAAYGYTGKGGGFSQGFNDKYEIQVVNPKNGKVVTANLKDIGPGVSTGAGIDLLAGTRARLGLDQNFKGPVQYRVVQKGSEFPTGTTPVASLATASDTGATTDTGEGPVYIAPMDRSKLKTITGMGELSTQEELAHAHARAEDWVQELAKAGVQPTQKDYQEHLDAFYNEVHKLNQPVPGQQIVSPTELTRTTPQLVSNIADPKTGQIKMPTGDNTWSQDRMLALATYNTNQWVQSLAGQGQKVTQDEYRQEQLNQYNGIAKLNMGLQPTAMSAADAGDVESTYRGYEQLDNLLKLHKASNDSGAFAKSIASAAIGSVPYVGGALKAAANVAATPEYKAYDAYRNQILGTMTRGYGGQRGGTLTEMDVQTTKNWLPNEFDTPEQAQTKVLNAQAEGLGNMRDKLALLKGAHTDVSAAEALYQQRLADYQAKVDLLRQTTPQLVSPLVNAFYPAPAQQAPAQSAAAAATEKILAKQAANPTPAPAPASQQQDIPAVKLPPESALPSQFQSSAAPSQAQPSPSAISQAQPLPATSFDTSTIESLPATQADRNQPFDPYKYPGVM